MRAHVLSALLITTALAGAAVAKLPAPNPEAKAKADEAKAKTDWSTKVGTFQLCKVQDQVAARYHADAKKAGKEVRPGAAAATPCADPGPFAYTPAAAAPPIEAAGAHSPPETAVKPPSTTTPAAATTPTPKQ